MQRDEIIILSGKIGKTIEMSYFHKQESKNYSVEDDEAPHPDLKKSFEALKEHLALAHYAEGEDQDHFIPNGFTVHEKDGIYSLEVKGKLVTYHDDTINVTSGKIPYEEHGKIVDEDIGSKLADIRWELYDYMFGGKTEEGKDTPRKTEQGRMFSEKGIQGKE